MIKVERLGKSYGAKEVLKNVSFEIKLGEIVGILGQNGAGKTTLMRILTGYLLPNDGKVEIDGLDMAKNFLKIREKIGYLPETPPLYTGMRVYDYLAFAARLKNVPSSAIKARIKRVLADCSLEDVEKRTISTLSKGYKQRVGIAQAVINDPKILILDEPTSGLDPVQIQQVRKLIKNIEKQRTVILSTHVLSEIEQMAQRVVMIKNGRIIEDSSLPEILQRHQGLEEAFLTKIGANGRE